MDGNGQLNELDRLVLINTSMFFKMMLEDEDRHKRIDEALARIECKIDEILEKVNQDAE